MATSLRKYEPVNLLSRLQNELNDFFRPGDDKFPSIFQDGNNWLGSEWVPRIDIKENEHQYVVTADVPGVDPKDIQVTMANGMLSIKGERKEEKEDDKRGYRRRECFMGSFERSFLMPDTADSNNIVAKGKNGVLTIEIGKKATAKPQTIKIQTEG
jgi:HSP20 family protein